MSASSSLHDLKTLVHSFHPVVVIETVEEDRVRGLLAALAGELELPLYEWSVAHGLIRLRDDQAVGATHEPLKVLKHIANLEVRGIFLLKDIARFLSDAEVARQLRETAQAFLARRSTMFLTGRTVDLPGEVEHKAARYPLALPDRAELHKAVRAVVALLKKTHGIQVDLDASSLEEILQALSGLTLNQARQAVAYVALEDSRLAANDVHRVVAQKARLIRDGGVLELFPADDNRFQLGGFARLKAWLDRARVGFSPQAAAIHLQAPRGVLIVGVQGCGKSLAAKVIAREWKLPLLKLDAGRLFDKFIGESEKNFRKAIALAETMAPVVLWIDEIEKGLAVTGSGEADAGLSRRLFGAFLTWLQEKRQEVFVVATANDLSVLPPELLRKGRFDEIFFVDLPTAAEREAIFRIHLDLRRQDPGRLDLSRVVAAAEGFSGAEIEQAVIASLYRALHARQPLTTELLLAEMSATVPLSVSRREDIEALRVSASGRFVPVS